MPWKALLLCVISLLQRASCSSVRLDPSILGQPWTALEAPASDAAACVGVEYSLTGQGYHRTLLASIWREEGEEEEEGDVRCEGRARQDETFIIAVNITSNMYIDLDQMSQLAQFGGPKELQNLFHAVATLIIDFVHSPVVASGHIDTERPAMESGHHLLLVYMEMKAGRAEVEVPLHLRYLATGSSPYSVVTIPTPILLSLTSKDRHTITLPCSTTSPSHCHWHCTHITPHHPSPSGHPLQAKVPLGQREHVTAVAIVTITLTLASMLYLMYTFNSSQL